MALPPPYQELPPPPTIANQGTTKRQQVVSQIQNQLTELVAENERLEDQLKNQHCDLMGENQTLKDQLKNQHDNFVTEKRALKDQLENQHTNLVTENQTLKDRLQEQHDDLVTENQTLKTQLKNQDELTSKLSWLEETDEEHRRITDSFRQLAAAYHRNGTSGPGFYVQRTRGTFCSRPCYSSRERRLEDTWLMWADIQFALAKEAQVGEWKDKAASLAAAEATAVGLRSRVEELEKQGREREKAETQCRRAVGRLHGLLRRRRCQSRTQSRTGTGTGTGAGTQSHTQTQGQTQGQPRGQTQGQPQVQVQVQVQNPSTPPGAKSAQPPNTSREAAAPTDPTDTDDEPLAKRRRTGVGMFYAVKRIRSGRRDSALLSEAQGKDGDDGGGGGDGDGDRNGNGDGAGEDETMDASPSEAQSDDDSDEDSDDSGDGDSITGYSIMPDGEYISSDTTSDNDAVPAQSWSLRLAGLPRSLYRHAPINYDESSDEAESDGSEVESERGG